MSCTHKWASTSVTQHSISMALSAMMNNSGDSDVYRRTSQYPSPNGRTFAQLNDSFLNRMNGIRFDERSISPATGNKMTSHVPFPLVRETYASPASYADQMFSDDETYPDIAYGNRQQLARRVNLDSTRNVQNFGLLHSPRANHLSFVSNTVATPQRNGMFELGQQPAYQQPEHPFQMLAHSLQSIGSQVANSIPPGSANASISSQQRLVQMQNTQRQQQQQMDVYGRFQNGTANTFQDLLAAAYAEQNQAQRYLRYYAALMECPAIEQLATWLPQIVKDIFPFPGCARPTDQPLYLCSANSDIGPAAMQLLNARGPLFCGILKLTTQNTPGKAMQLFQYNIANIPDYVFSSNLLAKRFENRIRRDTMGQQDAPFVMLNAVELYFIHFAASTISLPAAIPSSSSDARGMMPNNQQPILVADKLPIEPSFFIALIDDYLNAFHAKIMTESDKPQYQGSMLAGTRFFSASNQQQASATPLTAQPNSANTAAAVTVQEALMQEKLTFDVIDSAIRILLAFWTRSGTLHSNNRSSQQFPSAYAQHRTDSTSVVAIKERSGFCKHSVDPGLLPAAAQIYFVRETMKFIAAWTSSVDLSNWVRPSTGAGPVRSTSGLLMPSSSSNAAGSAQNNRMDAGRAFYHDCAESLYIMLTRCISAWSEPSTLRWVVETWLTFIQPWRYYDERASPATTTIRAQPVPFGTAAASSSPSRTNLNSADAAGARQQQSANGSTLLNAKWMQYVVDNLPFYTTLLGCFAERFSEDVVLLSRTDVLTCVDRILRVYAANDLVAALERATRDGIDWSRCAEARRNTDADTSNRNRNNQFQSLSSSAGDSVWYDRGNAVRITDADLRYRLGTFLLAMLAVALNWSEQLRLKEQEIVLRNGFRNWLQSALYGVEHWRRVLPPGQYKELPLTVLLKNRDKCSFFISSIQRIFQIYTDQFTREDVRTCYQKHFADCTKLDLIKLFAIDSLPMHPTSSAHVPATPTATVPQQQQTEGQNQNAADDALLAASSVKYVGLPLEYEPLGPHEIDLLVILCNWAARRLNEKYGRWIQSLWFGSARGARVTNSLASFALKPFVEAPVDARKEMRLVPVARRVYPPRICLRRLANVPLWMLMMALVLIVYAVPSTRLSPMSYFNAVVMPFLFFYVYLLFDAYVPPPERDLRFDKHLQKYEDDVALAEQQRQRQQQFDTAARGEIYSTASTPRRPLSPGSGADASLLLLQQQQQARGPVSPHELSANTTTWHTNPPTNFLRWRRRIP